MSGKKKGGKVRKVEMERVEREEEERRREEEEEARQVAEREEQERVERERREEEERERLELKDRERREDELNELCQILEENQALVKSWQCESREKTKWERYMRCDGSPNPAVQPEINTFISLWRENTEVQIKPLLQQCAEALRLTEEVELLLQEETDATLLQIHQETLLELQNLIHHKHLLAAEHLLRRAEVCADVDSGDMQLLQLDQNVTLCLWANLSKNPGRVKFSAQGSVELSFELPRKLAISDVCVRILHTRYDHLTHLTHTTHNGQKHRRRQDEEKDDTQEGVQEGEITAEEERREGSRQTDADVQRRSPKSEGKKSASSVRSNKEEGLKSALKRSEDQGGEEETQGDDPNSAENQTANPEDLSMELCPTAAVNNSSDLHLVDLQQYTPLGGVFYFHVFHLPQQHRTLNSWHVQEISDAGLQVFPYPPAQSSPERSSAPVGVTVALPDAAVFLEEPLVARWDPAGCCWRTDGVTETCYSAESRSVSFKMESSCIFTLLQDNYIHMPFQFWELRPEGNDSALFTVTTAIARISIVVKGNQCMLQMEQTPALADILGRWMSLSALQTAMQRAGVNIFVNEYSDKYVVINAKDPLTEHAAYEQMALMSPAFAFCWSRWNAQCGQERLVLQACEHLEAGPVPEGAWSLYLLGAQRSQRLKMKERSEGAFSPELAEESEFHSTFLHMLRDGTSAESRKRAENSHYLHTETLQGLLCATRVLTFS